MVYLRSYNVKIESVFGKRNQTIIVYAHQSIKSEKQHFCLQQSMHKPNWQTRWSRCKQRKVSYSRNWMLVMSTQRKWQVIGQACRTSNQTQVTQNQYVFFSTVRQSTEWYSLDLPRRTCEKEWLLCSQTQKAQLDNTMCVCVCAL